jgi:uncharacterized membrane protein YeiH
VLLFDAAGLATTPTAIAGAGVCFVMRFIAIRRGWSLPVARANT